MQNLIKSIQQAMSKSPNKISYYRQKLSAHRLKKCYTLAPPKVKQYLAAEIEYVLSGINPKDQVLELGCGYGRVIFSISRKASKVTGIDISLPSLKLAWLRLSHFPNVALLNMNATEMGFRDGAFDMVFCIQNGISAFQVEPKKLIRESIRVTRPGGKIMFSSYSENFWQYRLEWFEIQSRAGLIGEIDYSRTGNGAIVCKDGFSATTIGKEEFMDLTSDLNVRVKLGEVDRSSLFCEMEKAFP
jgi:2-polyprenyl-6-hydroxyphenyl methylase/3-demethylubiquinone-9 3-methyltransferase